MDTIHTIILEIYYKIFQFLKQEIVKIQYA
jgi:hypothetical protein